MLGLAMAANKKPPERRKPDDANQDHARDIKNWKPDSPERKRRWPFPDGFERDFSHGRDAEAQGDKAIGSGADRCSPQRRHLADAVRVEMIVIGHEIKLGF